MRDAIDISVILCTYNRCQSLAQALDSVARQILPPPTNWEVIVVDNNSRDQTRQAVESFRDRCPSRFHYIFESKPGKSNALNTGIRAARGKILAFMDDDVTVEATWLQNLTASLHAHEWTGAGGRILPARTFSPPRWLPRESPYALAPLALFDLGPEAGPLTQSPFGTNMAFRRETFEKYGDFRIDLGPRPGSAIRNEDSEFGHRLLAAGERLRYEPSAVVLHEVPDHRLTKEYFLAWWSDKGRTQIREFGIPSQVRCIRGVPLHLFRRLVVWTLRWMLAIDSSARFECKLKVWGQIGQISECSRQWASTKKATSKENAQPCMGRQNSLNLKAGEWVEVRSREEILATLDERGCLEKLPFMPEMLQYCGKRFRVYKRADKTCQYIIGWSIRRVENAVHLEGARCDGTDHGGCEAGCLIFWKEAWLKRFERDAQIIESPLEGKEPPKLGHGLCGVESLRAESQNTNAQREKTYFCQATQVYEFSSYMKMWDPRQYVRDLHSGNLFTGLGGKSRLHRTLDLLLAITRVINAAIIDLFNEVQKRRHGMTYPFVAGTLEKTPVVTLGLQPGELVQVKTKEEIFATLDTQNRNRGLLFDSEMLKYCGGIYRVLRRVHKIIDEKTGRMLDMKYPCIILEGVFCNSDYHRLCPRAIYSYWREGWLDRVSPNFTPMIHQEEEVASCPTLSAGNR